MYEYLAVRYILRKIKDIQTDEVFDWYDCRIAQDESFDQMREIVDGIMDAISRVNDVEIRKS